MWPFSSIVQLFPHSIDNVLSSPAARGELIPCSGDFYKGNDEMSLTITIAAPFRHARKDQLKKNEVVYFLSFKQHWMGIDQANMLIARAEEEGLIEMKGDMITPLFDVARVEIPLGYKPGSSVFERSDPVDDLLLRISQQAGVARGQLVAELNMLVQDRFGGNLRHEAAAVLMAKRYGIEFRDLLPALREHLVKNE